MKGITEARWTSVDVGELVYTRLKIRYLCGCVGSSPSPGTNFVGTNQAPKQYQGLSTFSDQVALTANMTATSLNETLSR